MPPLLQLRDIVVTLGGAPLLDGAELSISAGDRIAVVGRNGSGKSTLFRVAAGELTFDHGTRFVQPSARLAYLPQEPDMSGFKTALDYVLAGLHEFDDPYAGAGDDGRARPRSGRRSRAPFRRRSPPGGLGPGSEPRARHPAPGRADQPPRSHRHRVARGAARAEPLGARPHQPRQAAARRPDEGHDLARPGPRPPARPGLRRVRGLARRKARGGRARAPQARPQDRRGRALDALRRHRAPQAQHAPRRRACRPETRAARGAEGRPARPP